MSTNKDVVESVLSEEPKKCQAIAEETGLEVRAVSNCLNQLRVTGRAQRADGGWIAGEAAAQKVPPGRNENTPGGPTQRRPRR
jgi:predicted ArsR family transcriptional regulator